MTKLVEIVCSKGPFYGVLLPGTYKQGWKWIETWKSWANFNTIPAKVTCQLFPFKSFVPLILSKDFKGQWIILKIHSCSSSYFIRGFKQRCFWATQCQPEVSLFSFNMPWSCQICLAKCLYSYRDHLSENLQLISRVFSFSKSRSP